jgi:hypothetical protein
MRQAIIGLISVSALLGYSAGALAADLPRPSEAPVSLPEAVNDWEVIVSPYLWATGISGSIGIGDLPAQDVDASFLDIAENLEFGLMLAGEARNGPWSIGLDIMYTKLGTSVDTPRGIVVDNIDVSATLFMGTAVGGYAIWSDERTHLDAIAGARLWSVNSDFDFDGGALDGRSRSDGATWVDPIVGLKGRADLGDSSFYLSGWGMIGGFGVGSDFTWDVMGGLGYDFSDSASMLVGYRAMGVDYSDNDFLFDVVMQGPVIAGTFRF